MLFNSNIFIFGFSAGLLDWFLRICTRESRMGKDFSHACVFRILRLVEPDVRAADGRLPFSLNYWAGGQIQTAVAIENKTAVGAWQAFRGPGQPSAAWLFQVRNFLIDNVNMELGLTSFLHHIVLPLGFHFILFKG